jgi:hypothetical protein
LVAIPSWTAGHFWDRTLDVLWPPAQQEPTLDKEVSIQAPKDFPYTVHLARPVSGTSVEIRAIPDKK